ncbi:major facilitator superfamily protein (plasmid) [Rhizobium gallicum]|uniref:Major facilitator superfamily protein n=1 Tax=Rhizobium gallicum TaxID=56730 RepID=A0A1L5NPG4_9HYPH|nr:MFS transporter [Rhizobium gallicum]APO69786.1 major facilitator superfamily protein [Rhizobium gallicum]
MITTESFSESCCADSSPSKEASDPKGQLGILIAGIFSIVAAGSYTTLAGLLTTDLVNQLGWTVTSIGPGIALNMILYGLTAPFAIHMMRRFGIAKIANVALLTLIAGSGLALIPHPLMFNFAWGIIIGIGTGCLTMAYGSLIVSTWFPSRQGTISGYLVASSVFGQFALLPIWSEVVSVLGWRAPLIGSGTIAALAIFVNLIFLRDGKAKASASQFGDAQHGAHAGPLLFRGLAGASKTWVFWVLVTLFVICGATTNGVMWSHFTLAASICGLTVTAASSVLLLVGIFNVVGTTASGWLSDRVSVRIILAASFGVRALALFSLPIVLTEVFDAEIITFAIVFGIMDVATVPPVIAICNRVYGADGPAVFGWVNAFHQLGAGAMAYYGSVLWLVYGSYDPLWYTCGVLCLMAVCIVFATRYQSQHRLALN